MPVINNYDVETHLWKIREKVFRALRAVLAFPRKLLYHKFAIQELLKAVGFLIEGDSARAQQLTFAAYNRMQGCKVIYYKFMSVDKEQMHGIPEMCDPIDYASGWFADFEVVQIATMTSEEVTEYINKSKHIIRERTSV